MPTWLLDYGVDSRDGPGLREMQALQSKRSEWVGLSGPNVQLVISTKSAIDEVASIRTISDPYMRGHKRDE